MRKGMWFAAAIALFFTAPRGTVAQQSEQTQQTASAAQQQKSQASPAQSQSKTKTDPLAEAARKAREAQKTAPKAARVFTNDNIPNTPGAVSVVGNASASEKSPASAGEGTVSSGANDEASWRGKFADARHKLEQDQAALAIMQRELSQLQLQYYPDPTKALMQSFDRSDIIKKQQAITDKQKQIDADQHALSSLEDDLRKAGGDPGWARE